MRRRVRDRKAALNFITVTPRQLIEKEGKEAKSVRVNVFTREVKSNRDLLGHKEDFRVNAQYLMATATVGEELSTERELGEHSVSLCEDETSIFLQTSLLQPNQRTPEKDTTVTTAGNASTSPVLNQDLVLVRCARCSYPHPCGTQCAVHPIAFSI